MPRPDLFLEPGAGFRLAVAEHHHARVYSPNEIEQFIAIGVSGQIEIFQLTTPGHLSARAAEDESLTDGCGFEPSARSAGISITDKKDGLALVANHAQGQIVRGGILAHH